MGHSSEGQCDFYQVHDYCYVRKSNHAFSRQGQLLQPPLVYFFRFLFMVQTHLCSSRKDTGQTNFSQWLETGHNPNCGRIQICIKNFLKLCICTHEYKCHRQEKKKVTFKATTVSTWSSRYTSPWKPASRL